MAALGGEVGAIGARAFVQLRVRHDMVEEAPALGLGRVEPAGGEHEVERPAQPDQAGQALRAAAAGRQAVAGVLAADARALGGEHRVAGDDDLHAAGQRESLHRRHDGQRRGLEAPRRLVDGADEGGKRLGGLAPVEHLVEVGAGAELPAVRVQQHGAHRGVRLEPVHAVPQPVQQFGRDAVELVRPVEGQHPHPAIHRNQHSFRHRPLPATTLPYTIA